MDTAEKLSSPVEKIREELTCAICQDTFRTPKTLPCMHTFCAQCLEATMAVQKESRNALSCPTCRQVFELGNDVAKIATNTTYASLLGHISFESQPGTRICGKCSEDLRAPAVAFCNDCGLALCEFCCEMHRRVKTLRHHNYSLKAGGGGSGAEAKPVTAAEAATTPTRRSCPKHSVELKWYCITCEVSICFECTLKDHRGHDFEYAVDVAQSKGRDIEGRAPALLTRLGEIREALDKCEKAKGVLKLALGERSRKVAECVSEVRESAEAQGRRLLDQLELRFRPKHDDIAESVKKLRRSEAQIAEMMAFIKGSLPNVADVTLLQEKKVLCDKLLETDVSVKLNTKVAVEVARCPGSLGDIASLLSTEAVSGPKSIAFCDPGLAYVQGIETVIAVRACDASGNILDHGGKCTAEVSCRISTLSAEDHTFQPNVTDHANGRYSVHYTPLYPGKNLLAVKMDGVHVEGSPFQLSVQRNYERIAMEPKEFAVINASPMGVVILPENRLAVSATDCVVHVCELPSGKEVRRLMSDFVRPYAMAVDPRSHDLWVTDREGHTVHKFSKDGVKLLHLGQKGSKISQFLNPRGVAVHPTAAKIYVSDMRNNRIQVFDSDGTYNAQFGCGGKGPGQFDLPAGMCFNHFGHLVVCDDRNCRLQVFDGEGLFVRTLGVKSHTGWLCSPISVSCDAYGRFVVTEFGSHCISFLDPSGEILNSVRTIKGYGHFIHPRGVAVDSYGYVYVADNENMRVIRF